MSEEDASSTAAFTNHPANTSDVNNPDNSNATVAITTATHNGATTHEVDQLLTQTNSPHVFRSLDESPVIVRPPSAIIRPSSAIDWPSSAIVLPSPVIDRPPQAAPMGNAPTRDRDSKNEVNSCCTIRSPNRQRKSLERNSNNDDVTKQNGVETRDKSKAHQDGILGNSDKDQGNKKGTRGTVTFEDSTLSTGSATSEDEYFDIENPDDYLEHRSQSIIYDYGGEGCDRLSFLQKAVDAERQKETKDDKALVEGSSVDKVSTDNKTEEKNNDSHVSDGSSVDGACVGKRVVDIVPALEGQDKACNVSSTESQPKPVTPVETIDAGMTAALPNTVTPTGASDTDIVQALPKSAHSVETRGAVESQNSSTAVDTCKANYTDVSQVSVIPVETTKGSTKPCESVSEICTDNLSNDKSCTDNVSDDNICTDNVSDDSNDLEYSQYDNVHTDLIDNRADSPQGVEEESIVCAAHVQQENVPKTQRDLDSMFDKILEPLMIVCPPNELSLIEHTDTGSVTAGRPGKLIPPNRPDSSGSQQLSPIGSGGSIWPRRAHPASESSEGELSTPSGEAVTAADIFAQTDSDCSGVLTPNNIEKRKQMDFRYKPDSIEETDVTYGGNEDNCAELEELQAVLRKPDDQSSSNLCSGVTLRSPDFMSNGRGSRGSTCYSRTESDLSISEHRDDVSTDGILGDDEDECEVLLCKTYTEPQQGSEVLLSCTIVNSAYKDGSHGDYWSDARDAREEDFRLFDHPLEPEEESESTDAYKDARLKMKDIHVHLQNLRMQMEQLNDDLLSMSDDDEYLSVTN